MTTRDATQNFTVPHILRTSGSHIGNSHYALFKRSFRATYLLYAVFLFFNKIHILLKIRCIVHVLLIRLKLIMVANIHRLLETADFIETRS